MKVHTGKRWMKEGFSLLWDINALKAVIEPRDVLPLRQVLAMNGTWPEPLPASDGDALVVTGLEGYLDVLAPAEAIQWIEDDLRKLAERFQGEFDGQSALIVWVPSGNPRVRWDEGREGYLWHGQGKPLPLGQALWAGAESDAEHIIFPPKNGADPLGKDWGGLFHPRMS